jgi:hypothetical protein
VSPYVQNIPICVSTSMTDGTTLAAYIGYARLLEPPRGRQGSAAPGGWPGWADRGPADPVVQLGGYHVLGALRRRCAIGSRTLVPATTLFLVGEVRRECRLVPPCSLISFTVASARSMLPT